MAELFIIQHIDQNEELVDSMRIFKSFDDALTALSEWLVSDTELLNYSFTRHVFDEKCNEYIIEEDYDISEYVDIEEFQDDVTVIDSSEEENDL
jgi:hypothetical protein